MWDSQPQMIVVSPQVCCIKGTGTPSISGGKTIQKIEELMECISQVAIHAQVGVGPPGVVIADIRTAEVHRSIINRRDLAMQTVVHFER